MTSTCIASSMIRKIPAGIRVPFVLAMALLAPIVAQGAGGPVPVEFQQDTRLSGDQTYEQAVVKREPSIASNLGDSRNVVAFYRDQSSPRFGHPGCRTAFTLDGGLSWTLGPFAPSEFGNPVSGDPAVVADADGNFWFAYIDGDINDAYPYIVDSRLGVARSSDGGRSYDRVSVAVDGDPNISFYVDKPYLAVDTGAASRFKGRLYASYGGDLREGGYKIDVVVSRDGARTWSSPVRVSRVASLLTDDVILGSLPIVATDGTAYIFYLDGNGRIGPTSIKFVKSTDGGRRWSKPADAAANLNTAPLHILRNADPQFGVQPEVGIIGNSFPTAVTTPDGAIFLAWVDFPNGRCVDLSEDGSARPTCFNADVRMSVSRNGGKSWSPPAKVTDETGDSDQFFPWVAAHPDGLVSLMWLDRRLDPENIDYNVFYTNTRDGVAFLPNVRASSATSPVGTFSGNVFGDYNGITGTADAVHLVWGDMRDNGVNPEVYAVTGILRR